MSKILRPLLVLSLLIVALAPVGAQDLGRGLPARHVGPGPIHKVVILADEAEVLGALAALGAVQKVEDYGSFQVAFVTESPFGGRDGIIASGLRVRDEYDLMAFNGYRIDAAERTSSLGRLPLDLTYGDPVAPSLDPNALLYIIQFHAPVRDAWLTRLRDAGARIIQFVPSNGYVVEVGSDDVPILERLLADMPELQLVTAYHPALKMTPEIRQAWRSGLDQSLPVTVQLVAGDEAAVDFISSQLDEVETLTRVGLYVNVRGRLAPALFASVAAHPRVFAVEPLGVRQRNDEAQAQIMAGNYSGAAPNGPGYLAWLASMGFNSSQFTSFAVNVVDDAMSLTGHPDLPSSRVAFALNPSNQTGAESGHGFLNAHIVGGFNNSTGSAVEDALGYNYGLGIAPWAQVGSTAIFGGSSASSTAWENNAYSLGARISTNSWTYTSGIFANPIPSYDSNAQEYDFIVRDARASVGGNQELVVLFAASNDGPQANTVSTPTTAKNVISVGASENFRQTGTDGCGIGNSGADDLNDIISFSSRGPTNDGRFKPEIVAPGTHVQAGVPQTNYGGGGVCNDFWPLGQTLYGWSSGTSHSTPAAAGASALIRQWYLNNGQSPPSPALTKALLANTAKYLTGTGANDTLPSNSQGMGLVNLGRTFMPASRIVVDQTQVLGAAGSSWSTTGSVVDNSLPLRVTLAWSDAPGASSTSPWVNDLDLSVTVGGQTYRGNVFSGATSISGGSHDFRNNLESVFLPAGVSGALTVTVTAASIGGDGVPGNADATDQDFAIVIWNATENLTPPVAGFSGSPVSGTAPLTVNFSDQSTGSVSAWSWNFGDGGTSTATNPSHTYTSPGIYDVSLTVSGPAGSDFVTMTGYVSVTAPPPPAAPSGLSATETGSDSIRIDWIDNAGSEDGFEIERSADGTTFSPLSSVGPDVVSFNDVGLLADTTYWYRVRAFNSQGASGYSNTADATTLAAGVTDYLATGDLPAAGSVVGTYAATHVLDGSSQYIEEVLSGGKPSRRHSHLEHVWTFDVAPASSLTFEIDAWHSPSTDGDDFEFAWSSDNQNFTSMLVVTATTAGGSALSYALPPTLNGTLYIRVRDLDRTRGNQGLDRIHVDRMLIRSIGAGVPQAPQAPLNLAAQPQSSSSVGLAWTDVSNNEDGFEVERSLDGTTFSLLVSLPADSTAHVDLGLSPGQTYWYRVRAFNAVGSSPYSNTASATPGSVDDVPVSETTLVGSINQGSFVDVFVADGIEEELREYRSGGPPSSRVSSLEHVWTFSVTGGASVSFHLTARKSASSDNDDFDFGYSIDGGQTYLPMVTVTNTASVGEVSFALPPTTSGTVMVRVIDTDRNPGGGDRDSVFVDRMYIRSQ